MKEVKEDEKEHNCFLCEKEIKDLYKIIIVIGENNPNLYLHPKCMKDHYTVIYNKIDTLFGKKK